MYTRAFVLAGESEEDAHAVDGGTSTILESIFVILRVFVSMVCVNTKGRTATFLVFPCDDSVISCACNSVSSKLSRVWKRSVFLPQYLQVCKS